MRSLQYFRAWIPPWGRQSGATRAGDAPWEAKNLIQQRKTRSIVAVVIGLGVLGLIASYFGLFSSHDEMVKSSSPAEVAVALPFEENRSNTKALPQQKVVLTPPPITKVTEPVVDLAQAGPAKNYKIAVLASPGPKFRKASQNQRPSMFAPSKTTAPKTASSLGASKLFIKDNSLLGNRATAEPLYEKAKWYHRQERFDEAIAFYLQVVKHNPNHFNARFNLVSCYVETRDFAKANSMASELRKDYPENQQLVINIAMALIGVGQNTEAIALLEQQPATTLNHQFEVYFYQGLAYRHLNQPDKAMALYLKAEKLRPRDARLLFNLAMLWDHEQNFMEAINYYQKYLLTVKTTDSIERQKVEQRVRLLQASIIPHQVKDSPSP